MISSNFSAKDEVLGSSSPQEEIFRTSSEPLVSSGLEQDKVQNDSIKKIPKKKSKMELKKE